MKFNAFLSDTNAELITAYRAVKNNVKDVIRLLQIYETDPPYSKEQQAYYFRLRALYNNRVLSINRVQSSSDIEIAALFIVLIMTCFKLWALQSK